MYKNKDDKYWTSIEVKYIYALEFLNGDIYTLDEYWWCSESQDWNIMRDLLTNPFEDKTGRVWSHYLLKSCDSLMVAKRTQKIEYYGFWKDKRRIVSEEIEYF